MWPRQRRLESVCNCYDCHDDSFFHREQEEPKEAAIPDGLEIDSAYLDRMCEWDRAKLDEAWKHLSKGFDSPDDELIAFAKEYFGVDAVAVRTVFYFNQATGYDCPRIDYLYRK